MMFLPPARRTTMSGRTTPSEVAALACSSKSQNLAMPAISATLRSCSSPQRPRASGRRSALTRAVVWVLSCSELCRTNSICLPSSAWATRLPVSLSRSWSCTLARVSLSGATRFSTACLRCSRSPAASAREAANRLSASSRKRRLLTSRARVDSDWKCRVICSST